MFRNIIRPWLVIILFNILILPYFIFFSCTTFGRCLKRSVTRILPSKRAQAKEASTKKEAPKCVVITGAASGIGRQLAIDYAMKYPFIKLVLIVRKLDARSESLKETCERHSAHVIVRAIDVTDREKLKALIEEIDAEQRIDIVIANAGVSYYTLKNQATERRSNEDIDYDVFNINLMGVLNVVNPAITAMKRRKHGQIVIVSSQTANVPQNSSYACSKNAIANYGRFLRASLARYGITVTNILPGWVQTPMADQATGEYKAGMIDVNKASRMMLRAIEKGVPELDFPHTLSIMLQAMNMIPFEWKRLLLELQMGMIGKKFE